MSYPNEVSKIFQYMLDAPAALLYSMHPLPTGNGVSAGKALTSQAGAWTAAYADVVAANAIAVPFWVWSVHYCTAAGPQIFQALLADATPTIFFYDEIDITAATVNVGNTRLPYPKRFAAKAQIQGKAGGAAALAINVSIMYATGL